MSITYLARARRIGEEWRRRGAVRHHRQAYKLKEAEADLAEAEQKVIQAQAQMDAKEEEDNYPLIKARADLRQAELEARKNPLVGAIQAQENDLAVEGAQATLEQLTRDLANRKATSQAGVAIQEAVVVKAKVQAETAHKNIEMMTLRAPRDGYVSVQPTPISMFSRGMMLPMLQVGDTVRAGMAVVQLPDLEHWEVMAHIAEADRGHLSVGQPAEITAVALPEHPYQGNISDLGGTSGPCGTAASIAAFRSTIRRRELRPGMTANIVITAETLKDVAVDSRAGAVRERRRQFVYVRTAQGGFRHAGCETGAPQREPGGAHGLKEGQRSRWRIPIRANTDKDKKSGSAAQALTK